MHRIDTEGAVANKFVIGNPQTGQRPTRLGADWPNAVQEEIAHVIEFANLVLNKASATQLRQAIVALIAGVVGTGGGSVPTTRQVQGAGLLAGQGGPLVADLLFTLLAASPAEAAAQTINNKAVTPASLAGLISLSVVGSSWTLRLGPAIITGTRTTIGANATLNVSLPTSFPNACLGAFVNGGQAATNAKDNNPFISGDGTSVVSVFNAASISCSINIVAFGY